LRLNNTLLSYTTCICFHTTHRCYWLFITCCLIFKHHICVGFTFMYVALLSSNICMLVIYLFYVTQKTNLCYCSPWHMLFKTSHNMHMFFSLVCSTPGPKSSLDAVSKFTVSQRDHTSSMVGYHDHVSTASCESQSTLNPRLHDNLVNKCGCRSSSHSSPLSETIHVSGNSLLKNVSY